MLFMWYFISVVVLPMVSLSHAYGCAWSEILDERICNYVHYLAYCAGKVNINTEIELTFAIDCIKGFETCMCLKSCCLILFNKTRPPFVSVHCSYLLTLLWLKNVRLFIFVTLGSCFPNINGRANPWALLILIKFLTTWTSFKCTCCIHCIARKCNGLITWLMLKSAPLKMIRMAVASNFTSLQSFMRFVYITGDLVHTSVLPWIPPLWYTGYSVGVFSLLLLG